MDLLKKIEERKAIVGVVGLGYVGLPLLMEFVEKNITTIGFDIDKSKVDLLNQGKSYIKHIEEKRVKEVRDSNIFEAQEKIEKKLGLKVYISNRKNNSGKIIIQYKDLEQFDFVSNLLTKR